MANSKSIIEKIRSAPFTYLIGPFILTGLFVSLIVALIKDSKEDEMLESVYKNRIENIVNESHDGCKYEYVLLEGNIRFITSIRNLEDNINRLGQASFYVEKVEANRGKIVVVMEREDCG